APTIQHPELLSDVEHVLADRQAIERQVTSRDGHFYLLRVLPYRGASGRRGVVVTLIDITDLQKSEARVRRLSSIVETTGDAAYSYDLAGRISNWNRGAEQLLGYAAADMVGRGLATVVPPERAGEIDEVLARIKKLETVGAFETLRRRKDG